MRHLLAFILFAASLAVSQPLPGWMHPGGALGPGGAAEGGCTNGGYTGSGPCARQVEPAFVSPTADTLVAQKLRSGVMQSTSTISAPVVATNAQGTLIAATTEGSGSTVALQSTTTATLTLSTASGASGSAVFVRTGNIVTATIQGIQGASTGTTGVLSGIPAGYIPTNTQICATNTVIDNDINYMGLMVVATDGTILVYYAPINLVTGGTSVTNTFTGSGNKGTTLTTITYQLN